MQCIPKICLAPKYFSSKGALSALVHLPNNKQVQVVNTHLQSKDILKYKKMRAKNYNQIIEQHIKPAISQQIPVLLGGDLNINQNPTSKEFLRMDKAFNLYGGYTLSPASKIKHSIDIRNNEVTYKYRRSNDKPELLNYFYHFPADSASFIYSFKVKLLKAYYELFKVDKDNPQPRSLSDHHPVEISLRF